MKYKLREGTVKGVYFITVKNKSTDSIPYSIIGIRYNRDNAEVEIAQLNQVYTANQRSLKPVKTGIHPDISPDPQGS